VRLICATRWISGTGIPVINRRTEINRNVFRIAEVPRRLASGSQRLMGLTGHTGTTGL